MGTRLLPRRICSVEIVDLRRSGKAAQCSLGLNGGKASGPLTGGYNTRANRAASRAAQSVSSRPGERAAARTWRRTAAGRLHCVALARPAAGQLEILDINAGSLMNCISPKG